MSGNPEVHDYEHYGQEERTAKAVVVDQLDVLGQFLQVYTEREDQGAGEILIRRVRLAREGAAVERCHTRPHIGSYSVGHHTFNMIMLLVLCWQAAHDGALPRSELMVAAAVHDIPERVVGDIPQPLKPLLGKRLDEIEDEVTDWLLDDRRFFSRHRLTDEEITYLHTADRVELYLWCLEQARMGNQGFTDWVRAYDDSFTVKPPPWPFLEVMRRGAQCGMAHLGWDEIREIAKL